MSGPEAGPAETAREAVDREYPFDPTLRMHELRGIEKLKAEPDRELAATMYPTLKRVHDRHKPREFYSKPKPTEQATGPQTPDSETAENDDWWDR